MQTNGGQSIGEYASVTPGGRGSAQGGGVVNYGIPTSPSLTGPSSRNPDDKVIFDGPMKMLQSLGADESSEQDHEPISRQILTRGEATMAFRM